MAGKQVKGCSNALFSVYSHYLPTYGESKILNLDEDLPKTQIFIC